MTSSSSTDVSVSALYVYPIKSCGGISLDAAELDQRGIIHDRRWMLVDETGEFVSQRTDPKLSLVRVQIQADCLTVNAPEMPKLEIPFELTPNSSILATVWGDTVAVSLVGEEVDRWFSEFLGASRRLVYLPDHSVRVVDPDFGRLEDRVALPDGFPLLLISEASLEDLNGRLEAPLPMNRFRPNIVVGGCGAFAEDDWRDVVVGEIGLRVVKPCARCKITTVDQSTAVANKEPLRTLATFRKRGGEVLFGQNLIHNEAGTLRIGDVLETLSGRLHGS